MIDVIIEGELYSFDTPWQRGGEADVYRFKPRGNFLDRFGPGQFVVKIHRVGKTLAQQRAQEQRRIKLRNFREGLPSNVAAPVTLAYDRNGEVVGFVMVLVPDATPIIRLKQKGYRDTNGITIQRLLKIFSGLRSLLLSLHALGVVVGDLNDKNILVGKNDEVYLIDADTLQFDGYKCVALVPGFADSRIVRIKPDDPRMSLQLIADFDELSDWLAFDVMLCQIILGTNPMTGGICTLADSEGRLLQGNRRIVSRISVFHPNVQLSDVATPLSVLPEALLSRWEGVFSEQAERSAFPDELLDPTTWTCCALCKTEHGRPRCPNCNAQGVAQTARPSHTPQPQVISPGGQILAAAYHNGGMRYLTYHNGAYRREDGSELWKGAFDSRVAFVISGDSTIFARGSRFVAVNGSQPNREFETHATNGVVANSRHAYWVNNGSLVRSSITIGPAPSHLTSVWVGEQFGVAFVQAGIFNQILVFDAEGTGLTGTLNLPPELGTIVDVQCVVGDQLAWVTVLIQENGAESIQCFVVNRGAQLIASASAPRTANPWLDAFAAATALAFRDKLIVAVPGVGLVRVAVDTGSIPRIEKISSKNRELATREPPVGLVLTDRELLYISATSVTTVS